MAFECFTLMDEIHHNCGVAAVYLLDKVVRVSNSAGKRITPEPPGAAINSIKDGNVTKLLPSMLLDLQNRGQLAAGISRYQPDQPQILDTYKDTGTVSEVFRMSHPGKYNSILKEYTGKAAIGHTRYATCGQDDSRYAQPFERHHGRLWKWFAFAFNGQLANFSELRDRLLAKRDYHFTLNTDTEIIMHALSYRLRGDKVPELRKVMSSLSRDFDGAYNIVFLDAMGRMFVARDPLGIRPMSWALQGRLFAAASESAALSNLGFDKIYALAPGEMAIIENGSLRFERFANNHRCAHCFFEWVYFSNVASVIDGSSVYIARANSGKRLAELETEKIDSSCVVVPVPDTAKAAADAFAYTLGIPCVEGLIRNRYIGRTFIQPVGTRGMSAKGKYTPLPDVLKGKKVFLVEDSIVRSTTLRTLINQIRIKGGASEVHVRVASPPIIAPCFYGIDMSTMGELFAPKFVPKNYCGNPTIPMQKRMAKELGVDTLRYLSVNDIAECIGIEVDHLCTACATGKYPTPWGQKLLRKAKRMKQQGRKEVRPYEM